MNKMEQQFIAEDRETVLGVPIQWGEDDQGNRYVNRFAYASEYSDVIKAKRLFKMLFRTFFWRGQTAQ